MIEMSNPKNNMRPAFSMITAIFVIVVMASIGAFILNLSGKMVQETSAQYRHEQAILYAKSYTEFAIMAATAKSCVKKISANVDGDQNQVKQGQGYRVEVFVHYIGGCDANTSTLTYPNSRANVLRVDTYVRYRDPDDPRSLSSIPWSSNHGITYHRRTIQRL